ncbi:class III signal peptide-containing protein [Thermococcus sp.]
MPARKKRGQISLEFMLVFGIMLLMLVYSINNASFKGGSSSAQTLQLQVLLEEKGIANVIAGAIDQVYSQGPGSKVTVYAHFDLLRDEYYLKKAFGYSLPVVNITLLGNGSPLLPAGSTGGVILVGVNQINATPVVAGTNKTAVEVGTFYPYNGTSLSLAFYPAEVPNTPHISDIPPTMKIIVQWNPDQAPSLTFNSTTGALYININPGG